MYRAILFFGFSFLLFHSSAQQITKEQFKEDFEYFWSSIKTDYCYWDKKKTDWDKVKSIYSKELDTITTQKSFVLLLEKLFNEFYDHHASLNTNTNESQRLVPSGADLWAEYVNGKPVITEVRKNFGADKVGMKAGMEILSVNDVPVGKATEDFLPRSFAAHDQESKNFALRVLIAGKHSQKRKITVRYQGKQSDFYPDETKTIDSYSYGSLIESKTLNNNIGYIRINNCLGDNELIAQFDSVLNQLMSTKALILDLRETPSGGNTSVARAIIGRFIQKEGFYQKHELTAEETATGIKRSWEEIVSPRKNPYTKPLILLVDHWTGSVGEGITIGFDALKRVTIIGTKMAGLNGAVYSYQMPNTRIGFNFPVEKLFHVNGSPRESFKPHILVDVSKQKDNEDLILKTALAYITKPK